MNLRQVGESSNEGAEGASHFSKFTMANFRIPDGVIGNLGENLRQHEDEDGVQYNEELEHITRDDIELEQIATGVESEVQTPSAVIGEDNYSHFNIMEVSSESLREFMQWGVDARYLYA